jgi:hypothetical protein
MVGAAKPGPEDWSPPRAVALQRPIQLACSQAGYHTRVPADWRRESQWFMPPTEGWARFCCWQLPPSLGAVSDQGVPWLPSDVSSCSLRAPGMFECSGAQLNRMGPSGSAFWPSSAPWCAPLAQPTLASHPLLTSRALATRPLPGRPPFLHLNREFSACAVQSMRGSGVRGQLPARVGARSVALSPTKSVPASVDTRSGPARILPPVMGSRELGTKVPLILMATSRNF